MRAARCRRGARAARFAFLVACSVVGAGGNVLQVRLHLLEGRACRDSAFSTWSICASRVM